MFTDLLTKVKNIPSKLRQFVAGNMAHSGSISAAVFSCPKLGELEDSNADSCAVDLAVGKFAIADGVSQSFDPRTWSRLVSEFAVSGAEQISAISIEELSREMNMEVPEDEPWYISEMRDRGSQSTFLSISLERRDLGTFLNLRSVGDCCAFHIRAGKVFDSWPFRKENDFPSRPTAVMTKAPFILGEVASQGWYLGDSDEVILATDAMARFLVKAVQRNADIEVASVFPFLDIETRQDEMFLEWADSARRDGVLEDDDLTLMRISLTTMPRNQ